jgi:hypothetical protein
MNAARNTIHSTGPEHRIGPVIAIDEAKEGAE